ncbi:protein FAM32A-like isoform X1 [Rhodamnia argentea]|uniref:Protein FAM32A-like isoform X1 n=1 Tax=Rhodamnia argentea TaxID=178133 RepID=A0A8B8Q4M9_9MYRT|nr:protein FAM32A-like isoform X1 [Rhodamnia argentea]
MSAAYGNVVSGKLKLKGRPLDVKLNGVYGGGMTSKRAKNKKKKYRGRLLQQLCESAIGGNTLLSSDNAERINTKGQDDGRRLASAYYNRLTPAERRFLQQTEKIELERLAKMASKSHRDRVQEFNQYLANPSERYDIPKVGPG